MTELTLHFLSALVEDFDLEPPCEKIDWCFAFCKKQEDVWDYIYDVLRHRGLTDTALMSAIMASVDCHLIWRTIQDLTQPFRDARDAEERADASE